MTRNHRMKETRSLKVTNSFVKTDKYTGKERTVLWIADDFGEGRSCMTGQSGILDIRILQNTILFTWSYCFWY